MASGYFHRLTEETPTRFWINNPSHDEVSQSLNAGAISCTTNPTYGAKLIRSEPEYIHGVIDRAIGEADNDDVAAEIVCHDITARLAAMFLPLFQQSMGSQGFVTLQSDPRKDEDANELIRAALRFRTIGPNFMTKIPVTAAGLQAIEYMIGENLPICATEVFAIDQAVAVCELYRRTSEKTGKHPAFYVTHIAGIFDEYLGNVVASDALDISPDTLVWAASTAGRKEYRLLTDRGYPGHMLGGGARSPHHFTDYVGGDLHVTINWSTAHELITADEPVVSRINTVTPPQIVEELSAKLPDFARAVTEGAMQVEEFESYGPVQLFRNNFIAGYQTLLAEIAGRRATAHQTVVGADKRA